MIHSIVHAIDWRAHRLWRALACVGGVWGWGFIVSDGPRRGRSMECGANEVDYIPVVLFTCVRWLASCRDSGKAASKTFHCRQPRPAKQDLREGNAAKRLETGSDVTRCAVV